MAELRDATAFGENLVPYVLSAVEASATVGEVMQAFEDYQAGRLDMDRYIDFATAAWRQPPAWCASCSAN